MVDADLGLSVCRVRRAGVAVRRELAAPNGHSDQLGEGRWYFAMGMSGLVARQPESPSLRSTSVQGGTLAHAAMSTAAFRVRVLRRSRVASPARGHTSAPTTLVLRRRGGCHVVGIYAPLVAAGVVHREVAERPVEFLIHGTVHRRGGSIGAVCPATGRASRVSRRVNEQLPFPAAGVGDDAVLPHPFKNGLRRPIARASGSWAALSHNRKCNRCTPRNEATK